MKSIFVKMAIVILIISSFINIYKEKNHHNIVHNVVNNNIILKK